MITPEERAMADRYDVSVRKLRLAGGADHLAEMSPEARSLLLGKSQYNIPKPDLLRGGLRARGFNVLSNGHE